MAGIVVFSSGVYISLTRFTCFVNMCHFLKVGIVIVLFINAVKVVGCLFKFFGPYC